MIKPEDRRQYMETLEGRGYSGQHMLQDYLQDLADDNGVGIDVVRSIVTVYGVSELFDGVPVVVEDYAMEHCE